MLGAKQIVAVDRLPERMSMAEAGVAIAIKFDEDSVIERLNEFTRGKGPEMYKVFRDEQDSCIEGRPETLRSWPACCRHRG
jgi:threonine dehydrogenase-like Zn-dependent dehydrogenase